MDATLYQLLAARAHYRCECGACNHSVPPGECDHFFGRAKADELESTCWILHPECHYRKTNNIPSAASWLGWFIKHCDRWGYAESKTRAQAKLEYLEAKRRLTTEMRATVDAQASIPADSIKDWFK